MTRRVLSSSILHHPITLPAASVGSNGKCAYTRTHAHAHAHARCCAGVALAHPTPGALPRENSGNVGIHFEGRGALGFLQSRGSVPLQRVWGLGRKRRTGSSLAQKALGGTSRSLLRFSVLFLSTFIRGPHANDGGKDDDRRQQGPTPPARTRQSRTQRTRVAKHGRRKGALVAGQV